MHGYANDETFQFVSTTENVERMYNDILAVATECLRRVPSMTPQTLGRNVIDSVRSWVYATDHDLPIVNLGWSDKTPVTSTKDDLRMLKQQVGDFTQVSETDVGESWIETLKG